MELVEHRIDVYRLACQTIFAAQHEGMISLEECKAFLLPSEGALGVSVSLDWLSQMLTNRLTHIMGMTFPKGSSLILMPEEGRLVSLNTRRNSFLLEEFVRGYRTDLPVDPSMCFPRVAPRN